MSQYSIGSLFYFFFFSSRRRHTRLQGDWSSDVCSSDLDLADAVGVDILQNKLRWLRPRHRRLLRASGDRLPLRPASVATLITSEVIEHVPNASEHLAEARRVLKPGGILIVGTPDYGRWLWWALEWVYGTLLPGA